jgi:hypothetical protein
MLESGLEPILQVTGRDRNALALQADLIGAWALGVPTVLALSGDPLRVGKYEGLATHVRDVNSLGLTKLISSLNAGRLLDGAVIDPPTGFLVAGAANPLVDSLQRLEAKLDAGVGMLQTNIVYDVDRFSAWFGPLVAAGITQRAPVLVGVTPPRSTRMLRFMHDNIPGVEVDESTFMRMRGLEGDEANDAGSDERGGRCAQPVARWLDARRGPAHGTGLRARAQPDTGPVDPHDLRCRVADARDPVWKGRIESHAVTWRQDDTIERELDLQRPLLDEDELLAIVAGEWTGVGVDVVGDLQELDAGPSVRGEPLPGHPVAEFDPHLDVNDVLRVLGLGVSGMRCAIGEVLVHEEPAGVGDIVMGQQG